MFLQMHKINQSSIDVHKYLVFSYYLDVVNKVIQRLPMLNVKEIFLGRIVRASCLFAPYYPKTTEFANETELLEVLGYKIDENTNQREDY